MVQGTEEAAAKTSRLSRDAHEHDDEQENHPVQSRAGRHRRMCHDEQYEAARPHQAIDGPTQG